jgi:hypothetical protein
VRTIQSVCLPVSGGDRIGCVLQPKANESEEVDGASCGSMSVKKDRARLRCEKLFNLQKPTKM